MDSVLMNPVSKNMVSFESQFTPKAPGEYVIQAIATGVDETTSTPDIAVVQIGELLAVVPDEEDIPVTPTPIDAPLEKPPDEESVPPTDPAPVVNFWAEPSEIKAGGCTTLYWEIVNVSQVEFGGTDRELSGSYHDCMCESQTYPLQVTYYDGSTETFRVTINVTGTCATPTPVPDTTPPNPPTLLKPVDGVTLSCSPDTILRWEAANDPSGISGYRIQVERHAGDNNWQTVSGSVFRGITVLEKTLNIECGWTYRWRVRAIDGQGNIGNWSDWFTFINPLT